MWRVRYRFWLGNVCCCCCCCCYCCCCCRRRRRLICSLRALHPSTGIRRVCMCQITCFSEQSFCFWYVYVFLSIEICTTSQSHRIVYLFGWYTGCSRRNGQNFGRVFLMLKYTDITQNAYIQSWTVTEIMAREVWMYDSCYTLTDYQIHIKTGRNMWFLQC